MGPQVLEGDGAWRPCVPACLASRGRTVTEDLHLAGKLKTGSSGAVFVLVLCCFGYFLRVGFLCAKLP